MNGASVITHNVAAQYTYDRIFENKTKQNKTLEKLSSGYKINRAGDDAAGLAISESMRNRINGLDQGQNNIEDGLGFIETGEGGLTETHAMLKRLTTLATQAANGTYNDDDRDIIQQEVDQLKQEIQRIARNTEYNGVPMLRENSITVDANAAITKINDADSTVSNYRAKFGATYNRLQHMLANNKVTDENAVAAESRIRDTDMAKAIAEKTKADILEQASQSVLAHTMNQPNQVLELLQS